jgi:hypothetical protein
MTIKERNQLKAHEAQDLLTIVIGGAGFAAFMLHWGLPFIFNAIIYLGN